MANAAPRQKDKQTRREQQRELQRRREIARKQAAQRRKWTRAGGILLAVVAMAAAVYAAISLQSSHTSGTAVAASLGPQTNTLPPSPTGQFKPAGAVIRQNGKPEVMFIGAQYCPFCAAERWSLVKALSQFGAFSNLRSTTNEQGQSGFNLIPTFDLLHAGYTSKYLVFDHKDVEDVNGNPLETLSSHEQSLFNQYDQVGSIPMVLIGGYVMTGSGYSPGDIDGKSFASVQHALQQSSSEGFVQDVNAEANVITALICHANRGAPHSVCGRPVIRSIVSHLR